MSKLELGDMGQGRGRLGHQKQAGDVAEGLLDVKELL